MTEETPQYTDPVLLQPMPPLSFVERYGIHPILFVFLSLLFIFFLYQGLGNIITLLIFGIDLKKANITGLRVITGVGQILFILVPTFFLARLASLEPLAFMRIRKPNPLAIIHALVGVFSLQQLLQVYLYVQDKLPLPPIIRQAEQQLKDIYEQTLTLLVGSHSVPELLFVILIIAVIPAIAEEFFFRGVIQRSLEKGLNPVYGYVVTGIIFGMYHLNPFALVPLAVLGIYLGFLANKSDSIWVSSVAHFFNNALACLAAYFHIDDTAIGTTDPEFMNPREMFLWFIIMAAIFSASTYMFLKVTNPKKHDDEPMNNSLV